MKKLLSLISSIAIVGTATTSIVACGKDNVESSDPIAELKKQVAETIKKGNILFTTKQNEKDKEKYFAVIEKQLIKLFDDAKIKYDKSKFKFETEFKEDWFKEIKEQVIESYIEIKDGFSFNANNKSFKIERVKIKLIIEKEKTEKKDLKEIIKVKRLEFANKTDPLDWKKLREELQEKNKDVDINYINIVLRDNNIDNHKAIVISSAPEGEDESIYTGEVEVDIITPLSADVHETNLGKFTGEKDEPSIDELHTQILNKNNGLGYNKDKVEISDITTKKAILKAKTDGFYSGEVTVIYEYSKKISATDISKVLTDTGLKFDSKEPNETDIKKQVKEQNKDINIDAVKIENFNTKEHNATAVGDGKIYTGSVNLILKYDIKLDVTNTNLQVYGNNQTPTSSEVNKIVKKYNPDYVLEEGEFVGLPTKQKAIIKGKDKGFYHSQVEINYKYISIKEALDIVKKTEIRVELRLGDNWNHFLVQVRDFIKEEFKKKTGITVPKDFGVHTGWSDEWTSREKHKVGEVFEVKTYIQIMTGFGEELPKISSDDHPPIQITIIG